jgi:fibronectin type 3 domain-containing protein
MLPPAPTGLAASAGDQLVVLSWHATPNTTSYNIWRATVSSGPYDLVAYGIAQASHSDQGLVNGTTYYYVVSALGEAGEGPRSAEANATPNPPLPAIPSGLLAASGDGLVTLTWDPADGAASYEVRRADVSGGTYAPVATVATTNHVDAAVMNGATYYYVVASLNAAGESSNSVEVVGSPAATPAVPANFAGFPGDNLVWLTWDAAANATSYRLRKSIEGGLFAALAIVTTTSYTDTSVTNGVA